MTDRQKNYVKYLDDKCKKRNLPVRASNEDLLGKNWEECYQNFTPEYTGDVINTLKKVLGMRIETFVKRR